jgi:pyruvate-ferredoxin/flavodoxin oxidoreductase
MHVATRTVATHALSIFGDHSDVMACRQTGFALLTSGSVQEAHDLACVAQAATLATRIPFIHCFDGFRTSHEIAKIEELTDADLCAMIDENCIRAHRERALTPDRPVLRGTAQNPDAFFQHAKPACRFTPPVPTAQGAMDQFAALTGQYHLFDYAGHPDADRVIVPMAQARRPFMRRSSGCVSGRARRRAEGSPHRPFAVQQFLAALPRSTRSPAVLDRTKEPGSVGEPLISMWSPLCTRDVEGTPSHRKSRPLSADGMGYPRKNPRRPW